MLRKRCLAAARTVGYAIPCPTEVPSVMSYFGRLAYAEPPYSSRGWAFGSTTMGLATATSPLQHLVWRASPRPVESYAKLVNGPGSDAGVRVEPLARVTIRGWRMRAVYVPTSSAAFGSHVVLIWTVGRHTYGLGFHDAEQFSCFCTTPRGLRQTLRLDEEFASHIKLVRRD
jgi:hypothetical protein